MITFIQRFRRDLTVGQLIRHYVWRLITGPHRVMKQLTTLIRRALGRVQRIFLPTAKTN